MPICNPSVTGTIFKDANPIYAGCDDGRVQQHFGAAYCRFFASFCFNSFAASGQKARNAPFFQIGLTFISFWFLLDTATYTLL